jgi:hypothetical protein
MICILNVPQMLMCWKVGTQLFLLLRGSKKFRMWDLIEGSRSQGHGLKECIENSALFSLSASCPQWSELLCSTTRSAPWCSASPQLISDEDMYHGWKPVESWAHTIFPNTSCFSHVFCYINEKLTNTDTYAGYSWLNF